MFKVLLIAAVIAVVATFTSAVKLQHVRHGNLTAYKKIIVQRCDPSNDCHASGCTTIAEYTQDQCHLDHRGGLFENGEMFFCNEMPFKRDCFTLQTFDNHDGAGCKGSLLAKRPMEIGFCYPMPRAPFLPDIGQKFYKLSGDSVSRQLHLGCDFDCMNCEEIVPVSNTCLVLPGHPHLKEFAFLPSKNFACGGDKSWQQIKADGFVSPTCHGEPNRNEMLFADMCYTFGEPKRGTTAFKYLCQ